MTDQASFAVPAFVLEDAILRGEGATTSIVVTQPRRVSAIGVASRVAQERCEELSPSSPPSADGLVGYAIRGERRAGRSCRALFCTTGVVLARLGRGGDPDLDGVSHIFIDEVHERSVDSDFLLLELRDILQRNPDIKVILVRGSSLRRLGTPLLISHAADVGHDQPETVLRLLRRSTCHRDSWVSKAIPRDSPHSKLTFTVRICSFTHPVQDFYLESYLPALLASNAYRPSGKPARKATQAQLDRMRESFIQRGVSDTDVRALQALEVASRAEKIDFGLVGATVSWRPPLGPRPIAELSNCRLHIASRRPLRRAAISLSSRRVSSRSSNLSKLSVPPSRPTSWRLSSCCRCMRT